MKRNILIGTLVLTLLALSTHIELIQYGFKQAHGQIKIMMNTVPVSEVIADEAFPDSLKNKLRLIEDVRDYAFNEIGLNPSDNYSVFYDQKGEISLWNLSASEKFALNPKKWSFPILGDFPYKGFFDLEAARREAAILKEQGFDTRIRPVGGWSTLGWTTDPVLSNMLKRSDGSLAELIIHELTHSTLFVKNDIVFNENLAVFIGELGARNYLAERYGIESEQYKQYVQDEADSKKFIAFIIKRANGLDELYLNFEYEDSSKKLELKTEYIRSMVDELDTISFSNKRYNRIFSKTLPNNAYFMSYLRYYSKEDSLMDLYINHYDSSLDKFLAGMKFYHGK